MAAESLVSDLDLAFNLQLQEALIASLPLHHQHQPSTSAAAASSPQLDGGVSNFTDLQSDDLKKLEQELKDHAISETEFRKLKNDIDLRVHDHRVALEISRMPEEEWDDWGDDFERPFGEGTSEGVGDEIFKIFFKGLVEEQVPKGNVLGGIGVAICDSDDELLFELRKPFVVNGMSRQSAEIGALIEALNAALELQLSRVAIYCDYFPIYNYVIGRWSAKQRKVSALVEKVSELQKKFTYFQSYLVARNDIKYAFKLARATIISQMNKQSEESAAKDLSETCAICLEDTNASQIFSVDECAHRYCFSCMKQHVEVKLLHGTLPTCPHEGCKTTLEVDRCSVFLTPWLIEIMSQRIREASIPVTEKVYCPYPKCSALMSKKEVFEYSKSAFLGSERLGARKCTRCNGRFCINCRVPWHNDMTCFTYKRLNPHPQIEEAKLKNLAATNLWRQCVKCSHMIELAAGCYHMTCRCGYEFCYTCGAEWKNKKATCTCPLWDEENILEDEESEDEEEEAEYYDSDSDDVR